MSLMRRSDVRNHLSTRSGTTVHLPDHLNRPDAAGSPEDQSAGTQVNVPHSEPVAGDSPSVARVEKPDEQQTSSAPAIPPVF